MSSRQTKFNLLWLNDQEYKRWVSVDDRNDGNALCKLCLCSFQLSNMGKMALDVHSKRKKHILNMKESDKNSASRLSSWLKPPKLGCIGNENSEVFERKPIISLPPQNGWMRRFTWRRNWTKFVSYKSRDFVDFKCNYKASVLQFYKTLQYTVFSNVSWFRDSKKIHLVSTTTTQGAVDERPGRICFVSNSSTATGSSAPVAVDERPGRICFVSNSSTATGSSAPVAVDERPGRICLVSNSTTATGSSAPVAVDERPGRICLVSNSSTATGSSAPVAVDERPVGSALLVIHPLLRGQRPRGK